VPFKDPLPRSHQQGSQGPWLSGLPWGRAIRSASANESHGSPVSMALGKASESSTPLPDPAGVDQAGRLAEKLGYPATGVSLRCRILCHLVPRSHPFHRARQPAQAGPHRSNGFEGLFPR
jgi:hypothetical protein